MLSFRGTVAAGYGIKPLPKSILALSEITIQNYALRLRSMEIFFPLPLQQLICLLPRHTALSRLATRNPRDNAAPNLGILTTAIRRLRFQLLRGLV